MTDLGCLMWIVAFILLTLVSGRTASQHGGSYWAGTAWGVVTWLALLSAYLAWLTILDHLQRKRKPDLIGVPGWVTPLIWLVFLVTSLGAVSLFRRAYLR